MIPACDNTLWAEVRPSKENCRYSIGSPGTTEQGNQVQSSPAGIGACFLAPTFFDSSRLIHRFFTVPTYQNPSLSSRNLANRRASAFGFPNHIYNQEKSPIKTKTDPSQTKPSQHQGLFGNQRRRHEMGTTLLPQTQRGVSRTNPTGSVG